MERGRTRGYKRKRRKTYKDQHKGKEERSR
jgi:hypothetical protein